MSLRHNFIWTLAGNSIYGACQWIMLIVIAKLGTPEMVGRFALAFALTAPVIMFANLQLKAVQATDAKRDYAFADYFGLRLATTMLAMVAIVGIALASRVGLDATLAIVMVGVAKAMDSVSDIHYGFFQLHERMDRIAISSMIRGPLAVIALTAAIYFTHSIFWGSTGLAVSLAIVLLLYDIPQAKALMGAVCSFPNSSIDSTTRPNWDKTRLISLAWLSLPLGTTMLLISLNTNIPRYFIAQGFGERDLGIFAAMLYLLMIGTMIIAALADSTSPKLAKHYAARDSKAYSALLAKLVLIGTAGGAGMVALVAWQGTWLLTKFYGSEYAQYPAVFTLAAVATAVGFVQWFLGIGMTAARCFKVQVVMLAGNTVITLIACYFLVPRYGLLGAAITLLISNVALMLNTTWVVAAAIGKIGANRRSSKSIRNRQKRILHVVGAMNRAGAETVLMHILRHIDHSRYHMDFLVHSTEPNAYDAEIRALGGRVIQCLTPARPWLYARNFRRIIQEYGPYDIVHSHMNYYSGFALRLAHLADVPVRIFHSHTDTSSNNANSGMIRKIYRRLASLWIKKHANAGLAVSEQATQVCRGEWLSDPRWQVLKCGIDMEPFKAEVNSMALKKALKISPNARVVGHAGRFCEEKNQKFFVEIAEQMLKRDPNLMFLMLGDGPLRPEIELQVSQAGMDDHFVFAGVRADVPALMLGVMDVFVFPSVYEGLGLVIIEAQAAGLPCVISSNIPPEVDVIAPLMCRVPLSQPADFWAEAALAALKRKKPSRAEALEIMQHSVFNIKSSAKALEKFYDEVCSLSAGHPD